MSAEHLAGCARSRWDRGEAPSGYGAPMPACDCGASSPESVASSTPKRRIKVRPVHGGQWCICDDWDGVGQMIADDGAYEFAFVMMTDEEADKLGEFNGW